MSYVLARASSEPGFDIQRTLQSALTTFMHEFPARMNSLPERSASASAAQALVGGYRPMAPYLAQLRRGNEEVRIDRAPTMRHGALAACMRAARVRPTTGRPWRPHAPARITRAPVPSCG